MRYNYVQFDGYFYVCHKYGHRARDCRLSNQNYNIVCHNHNKIGYMKRDYWNFDGLSKSYYPAGHHVICFKYNDIRHKVQQCKYNKRTCTLNKKRKASMKIWKKKEPLKIWRRK